MLYFAAPKAAIRFGSFEFFSGLLTDENGEWNLMSRLCKKFRAPEM